MHELSIALSLIDEVLAESAKHNGARVERVHIQVGALSGVVEEALAFSYEVAIADTPLAGSQLVIESVPVAIFCIACNDERQVESVQMLCCPLCRTPAETVVRGKELLLTAIEISDPVETSPQT